MVDVYLENEALTVENRALVGIIQSQKAEIERLQEKVDRHQSLITKMLNARRNDVKHIRNTAHNDAIEAAAIHLEEWGDIYGDNAAAAIRALKR